MFLVGLTGGIASGKSTVSKQLVELGCPLLDADLVAREVVEPGEPAWKKIVHHFGSDILNEDGTLNREKMGQIIFTDADKRRLLNSITHPQIYKSMLRSILKYFITGQQFVVLDLPLLFEAGKMTPYMAEIIVVSCDPDSQLRRLKDRNNYTHEEAQQRIDSQMPLKDKCGRATYVIDNSGSIEHTRQQVDYICKQLRASRRHLKYRAIVLCALTTVIGIVGYSAFALWAYWTG